MECIVEIPENSLLVKNVFFFSKKQSKIENAMKMFRSYQFYVNPTTKSIIFYLFRRNKFFHSPFVASALGRRLSVEFVFTFSIIISCLALPLRLLDSPLSSQFFQLCWNYFHPVVISTSSLLTGFVSSSLVAFKDTLC